MNVLNKVELYELVHHHPLFAGSTKEQFSKLMEACELKLYKKTEKVLYAKSHREGLLLILTGVAEVYIGGENDRREILEVLQQNEIIGFSSLAQFLGEPDDQIRSLTVEVEAVEDLFCLKVPYSVIEKRWVDAGVRDFFLRKVAIRLRDIYSSLAEQVKLAADWGESEPFVRRVQDLMTEPVITIGEHETAQEAARKMVEHSIGSVLVVDEAEQLLGVLTDKDIVRRVATQLEKGSLQFQAKDIMTPNPLTISRNAYYYEALSAFYTNGVKHLPVIEDERVVGIVTLSSLLTRKNRGQMSILKQIEQSSYENLPSVKNAIYDVLTSLINDEISTIHLLEIITKLYDRLTRQCVALAVESLEKKGKARPPVPFTWYLMGSGARGEQFMLTDQDHFLVYADPDESNKQEVENYFSLLGEEIVVHLEKAGYSRCIGKMMSNNPDWRGSITDWKARLREWALKTTDEQILLGQNFLSFRFLYGDHNLNEQFVTMVQNKLEVSQTFLYYMAQQEREKLVPQIDQSFLGLFKGKKKVIDVKKHALFPLHHCLQVLGAINGIIEGTSLQLLNELVRRKVLYESLSDDLRHAYEVALKTRIKMSWEKHLKGEQSTTEVDITSLHSWEKDEIMNMLKAVRALQFHLLSKL
ncbi:MAG TPA: cyclic nucleotide-binding/CBS domain-containing protein [Bacillales bacterium]|nr:cyclic nucleotide-binding/CBS domain-containing protein [Bacillales bacterium]